MNVSRVSGSDGISVINCYSLSENDDGPHFEYAHLVWNLFMFKEVKMIKEVEK